VGFKPTCYFFHFSAVTQNQHKITDMYKSGHLNIISLEHKAHWVKNKDYFPTLVRNVHVVVSMQLVTVYQ